MKKMTYAGEGFKVVWQSDKCIHSALCIRELPLVFRKNERPWIDMNGASSEDIIAQVQKCPSRALSIEYAEELHGEVTHDSNMEISFSGNGPYLIKHAVSIVLPDGERQFFEQGCALCRCGHSGKKPFCDGSHNRHVG